MTDAGWSLVVDPACAGWRLDRYLSHHITRLSRARAALLHVVDLDDPHRRLKKSSPVRAGQRLWVERPLPDADAAITAPVVLHEDVDLLVLSKPPDIAVHPTASRFVRTVTWWLDQVTPAGQPRPEPAHRLDVETSGLLLCGRHALAIRGLKGAFAAHRVRKRYLAIVEGRPTHDAWVVQIPLGFATDSAVRIKMGVGDAPAETRFTVLERGPRRSLVAAEPISGRQHQIRAHLALAGHPIVGDKLYGPDEQLFLAHLERPLDADELARLGHPRQALHAAELWLRWREEERHFHAMLPADLDGLWRR